MSRGPENAARIRALNDAFRSTFIGGRVMITEGVNALGTAFESGCVEAVQTFSDFIGDNDPYGEHDFGSVAHDVEARPSWQSLARLRGKGTMLWPGRGLHIQSEFALERLQINRL